MIALRQCTRLFALNLLTLIFSACVSSAQVGRFPDITQYATDQSPYSIAAGDLNGDGITDLVLPGYSNNMVDVLLGNADGTFQPKRSYQAGSGPYAVTLGDVNGDGRLDVVVVNEGNVSSKTVSIFLGNGDGTLQPDKKFFTPENPKYAVLADFNGDGHLDIAVSGSILQTLSVLLGEGDGNFGHYQIIPSAGAGAIAAADFNRDGRVDLVAVNLNSNTNVVEVMLGNGDGTFQVPVNYSTGQNPFDVVVADLNNDGILDLATANPTAFTVSVLLGNGDGTFQPHLDAPLAGAPDSIIAGDFNGDGELDLATANADYDSVSVLLGKGDGTFSPHVEYGGGEGPSDLAVGDFNHDGKLDLAIADFGYVNSVGAAAIMIGLGDGTFYAHRDFQTQPLKNGGKRPLQAAAGDFNRDGFTDLVVTNNLGSSVNVILADGKGAYKAARSFNTGSQPYGVVTADLNGDGKLDLAVSNSASQSISILLGHGDGTFSRQVSYATTQDPTCIALADFNRDGKLDIVVADLAGIDVLLGNGNGTFQAFIANDVTHNISGISSGDFNGDGIADLALSVESVPSTVEVLIGKGDGTFQSPTSYQVPTTALGVAIGDLNNDGKLNIVVSSSFSNGLSVLLGNGDGTFGDYVLYKVTDSTGVVALADFNGDGNLDAAVSTGFDDAAVLYGKGDGSLGPYSLYNAGPIGQFMVADLNNDGAPDLVVTHPLLEFDQPGGTLSVLLNTGGSSIRATSSPNPSNAGQLVTFVVTVTASVPGVPQPTGTVTLKDNGTTLTTLTLRQGRGHYATPGLSVGTHTITTSYSGDTTYNPNTGPTITQIVNH